MLRTLWHRLVGHDSVLRVQIDPSSLKAADDREYRECRAGSSIVLVTRTSAEELRRQAFWARVDAERATATALHARRLRIVRGA